MGVPPPGKPINVGIFDVVRFNAEGKAVEHWGYTDNLAMKQQLGVVPRPA